MTAPDPEMTAALNRITESLDRSNQASAELADTFKRNSNSINEAVRKGNRQNVIALIVIVVLLVISALMFTTILQSRSDRKVNEARSAANQETIQRQQQTIIDGQKLDVLLRESLLKTNIVTAYCGSQVEQGRATSYQDCLADYAINLPAKAK